MKIKILQPFLLSILMTLIPIKILANQMDVQENNLKTIKCDSFCYALKQIKNPRTRQKGLNDLMELALQGDARAKRKIGEIFIYGEYGFKKDCKKGLIFLFESITKEGKNLYHGYDIETLKTIANMFRYGICVKKDPKKYKKYITRYYEALKKEKQKEEK